MELGLNKLSWGAQIAVFVALALAGLIVFQYSWVVPRQTEMAIQREALTQKRLEITRALQTAAQLSDFETQVAELDTRLERLRAVLPEERDASGLLRRLQTLATQSNLSIRGFTPQAVEPRELYAAWPTHLELVGTYHSLGLFFDRVGKFSQIITISDVTIDAIDPPELNATIRASCMATTYVLNEAVRQVVDEPAV